MTNCRRWPDPPLAHNARQSQFPRSTEDQIAAFLPGRVHDASAPDQSTATTTTRRPSR